jgi:polyhydroxybutyrate depolymerase
MVNKVVEQQAFEACQDGSEVTLYTIKDGRHCWPSPRSCAVGDPDQALDATPVIMEFLLAHPRPSP